MAATSFHAPIQNSSFVFDIYNDGAPARKTPELPGGQCNFVDLTPGANGARCGCRRFWSRMTPGAAYASSSTSDQAVWCMCSHHACFHDDVQAGAAQPASTLMAPPPPTMEVSVTGQENERPRASRGPLSPVQEFPSLHVPSVPGMGPSFDLPGMNFNGSSGTLDLDVLARLQGEPSAKAPGTECSLPDTMPWGQTYMDPSQGGGPPSLPPIPSQCLIPSQPPSTSCSSQMRYLQPFHGRGPPALSSATRPLASAEKDVADLQAETRIEESQASLRALGRLPPAATPVAPDTQEFIDAHLASDRSVSRSAFQELTDTVQSHEARIDKLETASFSAPDHDVCQDKHENIDNRVIDLESRVDDVEKRLNDDNSTVVSASRGTQSALSASRESDEAVWSHIHSLQAQVTSLQSHSLPSYNEPWEVEVVMLPFPLRGIWQSPHEFQKDWTQLPATYGRQTPDPQSPLTNEWLDSSQESGWLVPRAFFPGRVIDARLKSRGLVRTLFVRGSDARSVQLAVHTAFDSLLRTLVNPSPSARSDPAWHTCLGLHQPWVPLRKMHKDSRLRFLTPAEMATPTLWDVSFLRSSVVMKASGVHRLYVTQPEAYMQHCRSSTSTDWTWQRIRELARVYPDIPSSQCSTADEASQSGVEVPEADAAEECWAWNERLDDKDVAERVVKAGPPSLRSTRSSTGESSQVFHTGRQSQRAQMSPVLGMRASSPLTHVSGGLRDRRGIRPPHVRTTSLPPATAAAAYSPATAQPRQQRRVVSYNTTVRPAVQQPSHDRRSSPLVARPSQSPRVALVSSPLVGAVAKRRGTRSPSLRPRTTPRWSVERSPSLMPEVARGTTPFCYATPYSNAGFEPHAQPRHSSRGPAVVGDGYEGGDDMDCGSDTDPYDSQMTHDEEDMDDDLDFPVYVDEDDELDDADAEWNAAQLAEVSGQHDRQVARQAPEDEPWPGIEDGMSDGENMDPDMDYDDIDVDEGGEDAALSEASSCPSEYPSTQRAWGVTGEDGGAQGDERAGFVIHEDGV